MELKPYIASYSGQSAAAIRRLFAATPALDVVARVAQGPVNPSELDPRLLAELVEMRVLTEQAGQVVLATTVFLEDDIQRVNEAARAYASGLAERVLPAAAPLAAEPPALRNFLVGILAIGQSLAQALRFTGETANWQAYGGRYAASKVDFEQECPAAQALGPDLQNKNVLRGARFSAIFIGPGGSNYSLQPGETSGMERTVYIQQLNRYLTDAYAALVKGEPAPPDLRAAAQAAGLLDQWTAGFASAETLAHHRPTINAIGRISYDWFREHLIALQDLLTASASGRQGVPPASMMMHLWRSLRRAVASALYEQGFLSDRIPETGVATIFFENNSSLINELLG